MQIVERGPESHTSTEISYINEKFGKHIEENLNNIALKICKQCLPVKRKKVKITN